MKKEEDLVLDKLELDVAGLRDSVARAEDRALDNYVTSDGERIADMDRGDIVPELRQKLEVAETRLRRYLQDK